MLSNQKYDDFRVALNGKEPFYKWGGLKENPSEETINYFKSEFKKNFKTNYGILCGELSDLIVVDLDICYGESGIETGSIEEFTKLCGQQNYDFMEKTTVVRTGSGGLHVYFKYDKDIDDMSFGKVDIKSKKGYIVGPGSVYDGCGKTKKCENCFKSPLTRPCQIKGNVYEVLRPGVDAGEMPQFIKDWILSHKKHKTLKRNYPDEKTDLTEGGDCCDVNKYHMEYILTKFKARAERYDTWIELLFLLRNMCCSFKCYRSYAIFFSKNSKKFDAKAIDTIDGIQKKVDGYGWGWLYSQFGNSKDIDYNNAKKWVKSLIPRAEAVRTTEVKELFSRDNFDFTAFKEDVRKITFKSYDDLVSYGLENIPRVLYPLDNPRSFLIKRGPDDVEIVGEGKVPLCNLCYMDNEGKEKYIPLENFVKVPNIHKCFTTIKSVVFEPDLSKEYPNQYNSFNGFNGSNMEGGHPPLNDDELKQIQGIIDHIFKCLAAGNQDHYDYIVSYFSHIIQTPQVKSKIALIFYSHKQQVGKNIFLDFLREYVIGKKYSCEKSSIADVTKEANYEMEKMIFVVINEAAVKAGGFHCDFDKMKDFITGSTRAIKKLYVDTYHVSDYTNYVFTTNNGVSAKVEGEGDARYSCFAVDETLRKNRAYFNNFADTFFNTHCGQLFFRYLFNYEITRDIRDIPNTNLRDQMISGSHPSPISFIIDVKEHLQSDAFKNRFESNIFEHGHDMKWDAIFNANLTVEQDRYRILSRSLFSSFKAWGKENNVKVTSSTKFGMQVKKEITSKRLKEGNFYYFDAIISDKEIAQHAPLQDGSVI